MYFRVASTSLALIGSALATPATAASLQPVEKWELDYGDTQCTAARSYGDASAPIILGLVPSLSGNSYELMVSVPKAGPAFARETQGSVDFGSGEIKSAVLYFGGKGVKQSIYRSRISAAQMDQARAAQALTFRSDDGMNYSFALSNMPKLLDGLRDCTQNLQQYWNMDGKNAPSRAESLLGDVRALLTAKDYPTEALKIARQGTAEYQLLVDEKGSVAGCDILASSGVPALDSTGCEVFKEKARFSPAKDSQGKPVRSVVTTPAVTWSSNGEQNPLNNGCMWVTGTAAGVLGCQQQQVPSMAPSMRTPPHPSSPEDVTAH